MDAHALFGALMKLLAAPGASAIQFERFARDLGVAEGEATIVFYSGVKKILRELPDKAFADKNARLALVDALQDALDQAIEDEEEAASENEEEGSN